MSHKFSPGDVVVIKTNPNGALYSVMRALSDFERDRYMRRNMKSTCYRIRPPYRLGISPTSYDAGMLDLFYSENSLSGFDKPTKDLDE